MRPIKTFLAIALFLLCVGCPVARAQWDTPVPIRWVTVLPATCDPTKRVNVLVYKYSAPIGFYYCSGTNTWTQVNAAAGTGIADLAGLSSSSQTFAVGTTGTDFSISSTGVTHTFNLPTASGTNRGLLAAADFTTFSSKLGSLNGLTGASQTFALGTTGTDVGIVSSGTAHTFNFPTASASNRGLLASADFTTFNGKLGSLNGLTGATQTFATGTTGSDFNIVSSGTAHTFNFPNASGSVRGALSSADWTTFNGKLGTLNGLTGATQNFAIGAADTAAWASSSTTHTLNLPITAISGTSRTTYFPYFNGVNTLAKSPMWYTAGSNRFDWNNAAADSEFVMNITHTSGSFGNFFVGDSTGAVKSYISLTTYSATGVPVMWLQNPNVSIGDKDGTVNSTLLNINATTNTFTFSSAAASATVDMSANIQNFKFYRTVTAAGTVGDQTINKAYGSVNFAAGSGTAGLVVTNSIVDANSLVFCTVMTNDATAKTCTVTVTAGSMTIRLNANATAETKAAFEVKN